MHTHIIFTETAGELVTCDCCIKRLKGVSITCLLGSGIGLLDQGRGCRREGVWSMNVGCWLCCCARDDEGAGSTGRFGVFRLMPIPHSTTDRLMCLLNPPSIAETSLPSLSSFSALLKQCRQRNVSCTSGITETPAEKC